MRPPSTVQVSPIQMSKASGIELGAAVAERDHDASPIWVAAVHGRLDQQRRGYPTRRTAGVSGVDCAADLNRDQLGYAFPVAHDLAGEVHAHGPERAAELLGVRTVQRGRLAGAIGE